MRFWLKDSERRPDPAPVKTDDRKPVLVGLVAWVVAFVLLLIFSGPLFAAGNGWVLWTSVAGLVLGVILLAYTQFKRRA